MLDLRILFPVIPRKHLRDSWLQNGVFLPDLIGRQIFRGRSRWLTPMKSAPLTRNLCNHHLAKGHKGTQCWHRNCIFDLSAKNSTGHKAASDITVISSNEHRFISLWWSCPFPLWLFCSFQSSHFSAQPLNVFSCSDSYSQVRPHFFQQENNFCLFLCGFVTLPSSSLFFTWWMGTPPPSWHWCPPVNQSLSKPRTWWYSQNRLTRTRFWHFSFD